LSHHATTRPRTDSLRSGDATRRQQPIGPFIADFACYSHRLIVEIDGLTHDGREQYDEERDEWFRQRGWHVLRATDDEVLENLDGVVAGILIALRRAIDAEAGDYYPLPGESASASAEGGPPTLPKGG